jgi:serine/threonine protein phosphatase 1
MTGVSALAIVGDVHGEATMLLRLLDMKPLRRRKVVLVGDSVNRGPDGKGVLDIIVGLGGRAVLLMGNHELAMLKYLQDGDFLEFAVGGGLPTIRSYVGQARGDVWRQFASAVPSRHKHLLRQAPVCLEREDVLISHMGLDPSVPESRTLEKMVVESHPEQFTSRQGGRKTVVCGHYVQKAGRPYSRDNLVCIDTGCGTGGPLTALLWPERDFVQVRTE